MMSGQRFVLSSFGPDFIFQTDFIFQKRYEMKNNSRDSLVLTTLAAHGGA